MLIAQRFSPKDPNVIAQWESIRLQIGMSPSQSRVPPSGVCLFVVIELIVEQHCQQHRTR